MGNNSVEATYEIKGNKVPGIINGKVDNGNLKAIYQVNEAKGLMNFTFSENLLSLVLKRCLEFFKKDVSDFLQSYLK